uniref:ShKT domain-containing protein n=1 Tax=Strongyloides venezuelensis TaxID=75913 RepID=A0A0K0FAT6_STRVS
MNVKVFIFVLIKISVSFSTVCINVYQNCNNYENRCNMPKFSKVMFTNCPQTCGACIYVNNNVNPNPNPTVNTLTVTANANEKPIGPCLNGMCPSGSVCIGENCYTLKVQSSTPSGLLIPGTKDTICVDLVNACPTFVNSCNNPSIITTVIKYCPMTCGVCTFNGK